MPLAQGEIGIGRNEGESRQERDCEVGMSRGGTDTVYSLSFLCQVEILKSRYTLIMLRQK